MAVVNLTPDIGTGSSDKILCAGRKYIFEENDPDALLIQWMASASLTGVDPDFVEFSNPEGRRTLVCVPVTGRYEIYTDLVVTP